MNEARMFAELAKLPDAELLQASKITDPPGADVFYSGRTVVKLLSEERERCANLCEETGAYTDEWDMALMCADAIRRA